MFWHRPTRVLWIREAARLIPLPTPLEPVLPAQAAVPLPHHVPLAPNRLQFCGLLRVRPLTLELLVEGALLLQMVALGAERAHAGLPVDFHAHGPALGAHRLHC